MKLIWSQAESKVMQVQDCFYCKKCENFNKFIEIENESKAKGLLSFNSDIKNSEWNRGKK